MKNGTFINVSEFEKDDILRLLLHHMSQETRHLLMNTYPLQYNDLVGMEVMIVKQKRDEDKDNG